MTGDGVPRVRLEASHESALESVKLGDLKRWEGERDNRQVGGAERPSEGRGWVRESADVGGEEPRA